MRVKRSLNQIRRSRLNILLLRASRVSCLPLALDPEARTGGQPETRESMTCSNHCRGAFLSGCIHISNSCCYHLSVGA